MKNITVKMRFFSHHNGLENHIICLHLDEFDKNKQLQGFILLAQKYFSNTINGKNFTVFLLA